MTGFHNSYHKDEYHKVRNFFKKYDANGDYWKYGKTTQHGNNLEKKKEAIKKKNEASLSVIELNH